MNIVEPLKRDAGVPTWFSIMPKRHGQLKEYGIGPPEGSTANCVQLNEVRAPKISVTFGDFNEVIFPCLRNGRNSKATNEEFLKFNVG
jgi:hypothetical protein